MKTSLFSLRTHFLWRSAKASLFFFLLLIGANVWGQTATYAVSSTSAVTVAGTIPSGSTSAYTQTYSTAKQITSGNTAKLTLNGYAGKKITGITLEMKSNTSSGRGSLSVVAGTTTIASIADNTFNSSAWYGAWSTSYVDVDVTPTAYSITSGQSVVITISASANSLYIQKFTITYENAVATTYSLAYSGNGNTSAAGTVPASGSYASGAAVTLPNPATLLRTGFTLSGWNTNSTGNGTNYNVGTSYTMPSSNTTLYARWAYNITYAGNGTGVSGLPATQTNYNSINTTLSSTVPTRSGGYTFTGWNTAADGSGTAYSSSGSYSPGSVGSITLYAQWSAPVTYTLTYDGNDNTSDASTVPANNSFTGGQSPGIILATAGSLAKTGYVFVSWYSIPNGVTGGVINTPGSNYGPAPMPNNNIAIYARWRFSIAYNNNGGTGTIASQDGYYNGTTGVKSGTLTLNNGSAFTRAGYTFGGWKTTETGTVADYNAGATYTHTGSNAAVTLYAHWIKNAPTFNVTPTSLSGFTYVESNGPSMSQSFTLSGSDLENTDTDPVELVTIDDRFEIAESAAGSYSHAITLPSTYLGANKIIYVRLKAGLTVANYTDTVLISGGSAIEAGFAEVSLSGFVSACLAPATQSSVSSFTSVTSAGMTVNLTAGNGIGRVVKINTTNNFTDPVTSNALPAADPAYAGSGEQVIYAGTGNNIMVTGLLPSTTYHYRVYEYNICSGNYIYANGTIANNPRSTTTTCRIPTTPNGEITPAENPACTTAILMYEIGTLDDDNIAAGATYYWQTTATGTSTVNPVVFTGGSAVSEPYSVTASGNYYVRAYNGFCWSTGSYVTQTPISISTSANITTQPTNQNAVAGANANFTVAASGTAPFTYQWQESATGATGTWVNVGTSSNTLTLTNIPLSKNGYKYHVIVSNDCGSKISNVVTLSVISGPCFEETFNAITAGNNTSTSGSSSAWSGNTNFPTTSTVYQAGGAVRIGTTASGTITSRSLNEVSGNITVELDLKGWTIVEGSFNVTINGVTKNVTYTNEMADGFETKAVEFENVPAGSKLTISTTRRGFLDAVRVYCAPSCTPTAITAFPISGPANTVVTITGANFTTASTVKFGTANATVQYISATQLKAVVPANADGNIAVDTALDCDSETIFNLIKEDASGCEAVTGSGTGTFATDLIIYEVYDENGGSGGTVSIYNGTNAAVNLSDYGFYRANDYGVAYGSYGTLSGVLAVNGLAVIGVSGSQCGIVPTGNGSIGGGFNANDGLQLRKGSVVIDDFKAPNYAGYYLKRKNGFLVPKSVFVESEWTSEEVGSGECLPNVSSEPPAVRTPPVITVQPSYTVNCDIVNASLVLTATEGHAGGNALAYQWYELKNSGIWTAVSDGGVYSGATTQALTISDVNGLNNYQYYCQVKENTATCYTATNATQIKEASNTWASNVWTNGAPVLGSKVIIAGSYNTQTNGVLNVCDLTVNTGGSIRVRPNFPVTVKKKITNNASASNFIVESDANLIQTDNVTNEGDIRVERQVTDMNNISSQMDYVYWSSPVNGQVIKGTSGFSPNTPANGYLQYNETNDKFTVTSDATFQTGKGYAIRAETGTNGYTKTYTFNGIPNNGNVQYQNLKWTDVNHGFNMVGNPYPSNIDFDLLYSINSAKMYSTVWFWTNNSYTAEQVGSGYSGNNYAVYNGTGGSPATYNPENPYDGSVIPNGKIKVGQAFIIQAKQAGKDQSLDFSNSIRVADNGNFYQKSTSKNRFWVTMTSPSNLVNTILIGYINGATDNYETDFDGELFAVGSDSFYSVLGARKLAIQGKSNNFSTDDAIAIGNVFSVDGTYKIKLQTAEGIFDANQKVYLRDKLLNKYIDLSTNENYTFTATKGINNSRFEIVYKDGALAVNDSKKSEFQVYRNGERFVIRSSQRLGKVGLYDTGGKLVRQLYSTESSISLDVSTLPLGVYIIKAENSGDVRTKKIIK